jgi:hypothetical protein
MASNIISKLLLVLAGLIKQHIIINLIRATVANITVAACGNVIPIVCDRLFDM